MQLATEQPRDPFLPLRWESTGDQWWYATPIDWAAANGHYDLVRELLRLDPNLLVKLTSLRRIRRLESVWDDDARLDAAARNRAAVARRLLLDCEPDNDKQPPTRGGDAANRLLRAGYGGWFLYTAAAAGDERFARELLAAQPLLVFGEGEYGVTDILYAGARSGRPEVFRLLFDAVLSAAPACPVGGDDGEFRREMMNRAVHAAARGGSLAVLRDLLRGCSDAAAYRDAQGSTILHAAAAKGQVEVVKNLIASFDIANCVDDQGNTALHIAAFRGHVQVVEALITASPSLISATNEAGDTFLHMALTGFGTPEFQRLDRQTELIRQLASGAIVDISSSSTIINAQNDDGKTALHLAVVCNLHSDVVKLLMSVPCIDLNICDKDGMTPLDLLRKQPRTTASEVLIKQLILAGGFTSSRDHETRSAIASQLKMHSIVGSPGTSFKIPDGEIFFLHAAGVDVSGGIGIGEGGAGAVPFSSVIARADAADVLLGPKLKRLNSFQDAAKHIKVLFRWPRRGWKKSGSGGRKGLDDDDASSVDSAKTWSHEETPTPLRQRYSRIGSLFNKRTYAAGRASPSEAVKKGGVVQPAGSTLLSTSLSSSSSSLVDRFESVHQDNDQSPYVSRLIRHTPKKSGSLNSRLMNQSLRLRA